MKFLRHFLTFIVSVLLFLTIFGYTLILNVKDVVQHQVIGEVIKTSISKHNKLTEEEENKIFEAVDRMAAYEDVDNIANNKGVSDKTIDMIIDFSVKHIDDINQLANTNYTVEEIKSNETRKNLKSSIESVYKDLNKDNSKAIIKTVTTYGTVTSKKSTIYVIGIIIVLLVLLGIINLSLYKWIKPFGIVIAVSGSLVSFLYLAFNVFYGFIVKNVGLDIKIDTKTILIYGVGEIVVGVVILIIYSIVLKIVNGKKRTEPSLMNSELSIIQKEDDFN